ncbi:MAG: BatD family protein [Phenylobacterium sp.]|uniref:BatD family protein n=1 Tax=Phenylobacterium sp. TaxID=1871053 RepID=UPI0025FD0C45|nr:BatD family protein [Phenylobacterium sp.]MCG9915933.1 BatD family protein [Phenylobacterium sp.]
MVSPVRLVLASLSAALCLAQPSLAQDVTGSFEAPAKPLWAGEVFDLTLAWSVNWNTFGNLEGELEWASEPLAAEPWGAPALRAPPAPGASRAVIEFKTRAMALTPGFTPLSPARQVMRLQTGVIDMEEYQRAITETREVVSDPGLFRIRPLPPAPEGFTGVVGQFAVDSRIEAKEVRVGETLTWRVTLSGTGNWPAITGLPARQVSRDFQVIGEPEQVEGEDATLFERSVSEAVTLIPQRAGRYVLSAFEVVTFDPRSGRYVQLTAPPITLEVLPGPQGDLLPAEGEAGLAPEDADTLPPMMVGRSRALAPPADVLWRLALLGVPLSLGGLWMALALWRAYLADPYRLARRAHRQMELILTRLLQDPDPAQSRSLIRDWQHNAALRLRLGLAAPVPDAFTDPRWGQLWAEADHTLYGRQGEHPADWADRARQLLTEIGPPPPFKPRTALQRSHLVPVAAALVSLILVLPHGQASAQEMTAKALREAVADAPQDWRARHNLAVALAAQDRWEEAAGHAAIAWVQHPSDPQLRRLWLMTSAKAGYSLEPRASVPRPRDWRGHAIALASPAVWRWSAIGFAWLAALGLAGALYARYRPRPYVTQVGLSLAGLAMAGGLISALALNAYGPLASHRAVVIWGAGALRDLPVDTPVEAAAIQLAGGSVGRVEQAYLGWRRVRLGDGRTGWTREENLLWVWKSPYSTGLAR